MASRIEDHRQRCILMLFCLSNQYPQLLKVEEKGLELLLLEVRNCTTTDLNASLDLQVLINFWIEKNIALQIEEHTKATCFTNLIKEIEMLQYAIDKISDRIKLMDTRVKTYANIFVAPQNIYSALNIWNNNLSKLTLPKLKPPYPKPLIFHTRNKISTASVTKEIVEKKTIRIIRKAKPA